eukprot:Opistho-2@46664
MVKEDLVKVTSTKSGVRGSAENRELALHKGDGRNLERALAKINKDDNAGLLRLGGKILLVDAIVESDCSGVVHDAKRVEAGNLSGITESPALRIVEKGRRRDDAVDDLRLELPLGRGLQLAKEHSRDLRGAKYLLLAQILHMDANGSVGKLRCLVKNIRKLSLDIGVLELASNKQLEVGDGVLEVGHRLCVCRLANVAVLRAE